MERASADVYATIGVATLNLHAGGAIRALSVSLLAIAAIAASVLVTRRTERVSLEGLVPAGEHVPAVQSLDAIRQAGL